jgi:hypothetical protein
MLCRVWLAMVFQNLRNRLLGSDRPQFQAATPEALEFIRAGRFANAAPERFAAIWSEIANICGVDPLQMREEDELRVLCPTRRLTDLNLKMMELEALVAAESRGMPPPAIQPQTVGDILDYLMRK